MMLGRLIVGVVAWALMASGLVIACVLPYSLAVVLTAFGLVLLGGFLYARLIYVAQRNDGRDTWH